MGNNCILIFITWNVHSLRRRFTDILYYVKQEKPSIICLQEVLKGHEIYNIRGYTKYTHTTKQGLVTYVSNSLPHELVETSMIFYNNEGNTCFLKLT